MVLFNFLQCGASSSSLFPTNQPLPLSLSLSLSLSFSPFLSHTLLHTPSVVSILLLLFLLISSSRRRRRLSSEMESCWKCRSSGSTRSGGGCPLLLLLFLLHLFLAPVDAGCTMRSPRLWAALCLLLTASCRLCAAARHGKTSHMIPNTWRQTHLSFLTRLGASRRGEAVRKSRLTRWRLPVAAFFYTWLRV